MKGWVKGASASIMLCLTLAAPAHAYYVEPTYDRDRTALAVVHADGRVSISPKGEEARSALSLAKLYLGYWVLYNGTEEEKEQVQEMVATSNDGIAQALDRKYPQAIDEIAEDFDLTATARGQSWGRSMTSARDVATFIAAIVWDPVAKPLFKGMAFQSDVAADGFFQQYGTARLKDVKGSKMGWADDATAATASVSWGETGDETWAAAALTEGSAYHNTVDTRMGLRREGEAADGSLLAEFTPVRFD